MKLKDCLLLEESLPPGHYKKDTVRSEDEPENEVDEESEDEDSEEEDKLKAMDEDCEVMGVHLKLDEGCELNFSKHVDFLVENARIAKNRREFLKESNFFIEKKEKYLKRKKSSKELIEFK